MHRDFNADFLNKVANDPAVKGGARLNGMTDLSHLATIDNVILSYETGCFLLINKGAGIYEVHTLALKEGRGKILRKNIALAMEYMFFQTDCVKLITTAYKDNAASLALSEAYFSAKGETADFVYYSLDYLDWVTKCESARKVGDEFHSGVKTNHDEDTTHDCHVGGAILLLKNGNVGKGLEMYNAWAVMSGYALIAVLSVTPLIMQIGEMNLIYQEGALEEICQ
jgi:hypothetical protein